jgi:6-phosphofructokinase 1
VHVPKTIDNDLEVTDHCPGFGSAARFVAQAVMGDNLDNRALGGVKIDVIMGRHAGWLTAASLLAKRFEDDGPHLVYPPEVEIDPTLFEQQVVEAYRRHGRCVVAVSEGIRAPAGRTWYESDDVDAHGNMTLSGSGALGDVLADHAKRALVADGVAKPRVRADTFGYLQRSFAGFASEVDAAEAREVGRRAARAATTGEVPHGSVYIAAERGGGEYRASFEVTELANVAKHTRDLDEGYIRGDNDIEPAFVEYVRPLVGELASAARLSDFPL